ARKISCASNARQWGTAQMMYIQDFDEQFTPYVANIPNLRPDGSVFRTYSSWEKLVQPYVKNLQMCICPDQADIGFITTAHQTTEYAGYGMNYAYLNDFLGFDPPSGYSYKWSGLSQAA